MTQATLCTTCRHVRVIETARGSTFYLCMLSSKNDRFKKYPPQPVFACQGYASKSEIQACEEEHHEN